MTNLLKRGSTYEEVYNNFKWNIPTYYNIADDVCDRWATDTDRIALVYEDAQKKQRVYTFRMSRGMRISWPIHCVRLVWNAAIE